MDFRDYLKIFDEDKPAAEYSDIPSTGQDNVDRQKLVEDAIKTKRWSLLPQAIAGVGDTLSAANKVYGGPGTGGAQENVIKGIAGNLADTSKQFETGLDNNPTSDKSKQYQNLLAKFLGKEPSSFANMSAAQIKDQIPAIEKLSAMENQKSLRKDSLAQQAMQHADSEANRKLQFEALQQNRQSLDQDRDAKRALQEQQQLEGKVQKHATEMQSANLPELVNTYNELQDVFAQGGDVKGVGFLESHVPGFMLGAEGIRNRTNLQQLANALLKQRSGAAVSDQEYKRFLMELTAGKMPTEKAIRTHLGKMGTDAKTIIGQLESGLPTAAFEEYKTHPGAITAADVKSPGALYSKTNQSAVPTVGSTYNGSKVLKVTRIK